MSQISTYCHSRICECSVDFICDHIAITMSTNKTVTIYTDGSCAPNPGKGGWGVVIVTANGEIVEFFGHAPDEITTNNKMELTAAIKALEYLEHPTNVTLYTDSTYLKDAFSKSWISKWQQNNWKTVAKQPVKNKEMWLQLIRLSEFHNITWKWVRGHGSNEHNLRCDYLAQMARTRFKQE